MNALDSRIKELVAYARERDGEDRTALFRNLVDLFLTDNAPSKQPTRSQLLDVINALIPHVEPESRKTVADLLASMSQPPMDLVFRIVRDRASIVSKLLREAPFPEDDLIELVETTGREHHQELASRSDLSANVWIALARATPAAPPYGSRSTLALWKEDLGLSVSDEAASDTDPGKAADEKITRISDARPNLRPDLSEDLRAEKSAKPSARLRILRTDEDIVSNHINPHGGRSDDISFTQEPRYEHIASSEDDIAPTASSMGEADEKGMQPATLDSLKTPHRQANPMPQSTSKWQWSSDRDGLVTTVSETAPAPLVAAAPIGQGILDLLALNAKLGHPVSRAFQRRSHINSAPIYLANLDENQRYWSLDAKPVFDNASGRFEGYRGYMTPIIPSEEADDIIPADDRHEPVGESITRPDDVPDDVKADMLEPSHPLKGSENWFDKRGSNTAENKISPEPREDETTEQARGSVSTPPDKPYDIENILERALQESVAPLEEADAENAGAENWDRDAAPGGDTAPAEQDRGDTRGDTDKRGSYEEEATLSPPEPNPLEANKPETSANRDELDTVPATLELLDEALSRLATAESSGNALQIRLQAEIAQACARTLRAALAKK